MIQICQKDKEKVFEAIRTGKIDAAEMSFPNLIDDILLTIKKCLRHFNPLAPIHGGIRGSFLCRFPS